jgi:hypothetical protein
MSWVFVMGRWVVVSPVLVGDGIVGGDDDLLSGSVR